MLIIKVVEVYRVTFNFQWSDVGVFFGVSRSDLRTLGGERRSSRDGLFGEVGSTRVALACSRFFLCAQYNA